MALFEELELWDNLIACYRLLQKKPQACCSLPGASIVVNLRCRGPCRLGVRVESVISLD